MHTLLQDIRGALRVLRSSRGFALVAVLSLAIGIAAATTVFSLVNAVLLRPLPWADPDRLLVIRSDNPTTQVEGAGLSLPHVADIAAGARGLASVAVVSEQGFNLAGSEAPRQVSGTVVSAALFPVLGVRPARGRGFLPSDDRDGSERVVVLGHTLWQRELNGDPAAIGRAVRINGEPHTVIGVMPPDFAFPERSELWVPLGGHAPERIRDHRAWDTYARVAAGVTMGSARAELDAIGRRLAAQYPATDGGWRLRASTMDEWRNDGAGTFFLTLLGAVGFVLLIACANLATLLLARVTGRRKELALRSALGAPRARLVRQMVTETMVLACVAGALGLALSYLGVRLAVAGLPAGEVPYWITFGLDARVFSFAIAAAIVTGLVCSVGPALQASAPDIPGALNVGGRGATEAPRASRMRAAFVVAEIALALLLFTGAGLMIRAFVSLQHADMGFDPSHLLTASIEPKEGAYDDPARRRVLLGDIMERVERLPGVQEAAGSEVGPGARVEVEGRPAAGDGSAASVTRWIVTRGYFRAMRIPVVAGRDFAPDDRAGAPAVAIANAEMARRLWTNESALGKRLRVAGIDAARPWVTVIGVVGNTRRNPLDPELEALLYMPFPQQVPTTLDIALRTPGDPLALVRALERAVHAVDADQPVVRVRTMEQRLAAWTWPVRFFATCLAAFAAFALFLAALGIYGVVAYATRQRTREIGLRVALGATRRDVVRLILGHGARLTAAGLAIGIAGAYAVARLLASLPLGVRDTSPLMLLALAALFGGVALFASYLPARHALRIDPMVALRNE